MKGTDNPIDGSTVYTKGENEVPIRGGKLGQNRAVTGIGVEIGFRHNCLPCKPIVIHAMSIIA